VRDINWDEKLSDEDRAWAEQRPDHQINGRPIRDLLDEQDERFGGKEPEPAKTRAERMTELRQTIADSQTELARLEQEQIDEDNRNRALSGDPASGLVRDNTYVDGKKPDGSPEPVEDYSDEKVWTKAKLAEEIDNRNREREAEGLSALSKSGNRSELVERLMQDDREAAED
jgi:hypothetical protein